MGHGPRRHTPPLELRFVRTPTEVKHLTAAEFYRSLIVTRNKKNEAALWFFFNGAWLVPPCLCFQSKSEAEK